MSNYDIMNSVCKQIKSTDKVNVEYSPTGESGRPVPMFFISTKVNNYKFKLVMEFNDLYAIANGDGDESTVHEYFIDLQLDACLDEAINENSIHDNPELTEEERNTLHEYLREFWKSVDSQLIAIAESKNITVEEIFR